MIKLSESWNDLQIWESSSLKFSVKVELRNQEPIYNRNIYFAGSDFFALYASKEISENYFAEPLREQMDNLWSEDKSTRERIPIEADIA